MSHPFAGSVDRSKRIRHSCWLLGCLWVTCLALLCLGSGTGRAQDQPNFLIILADDMGLSDAGCYGGEIRTPRLATAIVDHALECLQEHAEDFDDRPFFHDLCLGPGWSSGANTPFRRHKAWLHEGNRAIRQGRWKLVAAGPKGAWELYDLTGIAFGDPRLERVLFLSHHEDDPHADRFCQMQGKMTVFGFGRKGMEMHLDQVPQSVRFPGHNGPRRDCAIPRNCESLDEGDMGASRFFKQPRSTRQDRWPAFPPTRHDPPETP